MAKKLTKAQIAKNPTKAINSGQMKMRKQEVPFGGIGKAAAKVVGKVIGKKTVVRKGATGAKLSPYSGGIKAKVSDNVTVRIKAKPNYEFSKDLSTVNKIAKQNAASSGSAKANARGLKAANKSTKTKPFAKGSASRGSAKEIARIATIAGGSALGISSTKSYQTNLQGQLKDAQKAKQSKKKSK
jgi:hypothetical protein